AGADAHLPGAWDLTTGSSSIVIAVVDDGCQISHPDLAPNLFLNLQEIPGNGVDDDHNGVIDDYTGYDFIGGKPDPSPVDVDDSHGTSVAGVAAAAGGNGQGGVGAAYGCQIMPIKVIEGGYFLEGSELARALRYAAGLNAAGTRVWRGADVVNISLNFSASLTVSSGLSDLASHGRNGLGCPIFVAAGNGASAWQPYELVIDTPGSYTLRWEYSKDPTVSDGEDTVWIDGVTFPDGSTESFEGGTLPPGWITGGAAPWVNVMQGVNGERALTGWNGPTSRSLRAGRIGANQTTYVQVTRTLTAGSFRFWAWVSSEHHYDLFRFLANGDEIFSDSGVPLLDTTVGFPASHPSCFAVGASTDFDFRSDYSQYGGGVDFVAPSDGGVSAIFTTDRTGPDGFNSDVSPAGDYLSDFGGTSSATPLSAGVAALVLSVNPHLTVSELRALMRATCDRIGNVTYDASGRNTFYGSGRVNAARALAQARDDLGVSVVQAASIADATAAADYTLVVTNLGPSHSGTYLVTNTLPPGVVFGSANPAPLTRSATQVVFAGANVPAHGAAKFQVTVTNLTAGTSTFLAHVCGDVLDSNLANNTGASSLSVVPVPSISVSDATLVEGNAGTTNLVFNVSLSGPSAHVVTVNYLTVSNTAVAKTDFTAAKGILTFQPGETNKVVTIRVIGDVLNEADEAFSLVLTNAVRATLGDAVGVGSILNDDALPSLAITNVVVKEGNSGVHRVSFKVWLSARSGRPVSVDFATAPGSARADLDYVSTNGVLTFLPGKTSLKLSVLVKGDVLPESNVTFFVNLSNPVHASLAAGTGVCTILNNDKPPKLFIGDVTLAEGDSGTTNAVFTVRLSGPSGLSVTAEFTTTNGTATAGTDYVATNGLVSFAPGETNQTISVAVLGDTLNEPDETFLVRLFNLTNAVVGDVLGQAKILNDDPAPGGMIASLRVGPGPVVVNPGVKLVLMAVDDASARRVLRLRFSSVAGRRYAVEQAQTVSGPWATVPGWEELLGTGEVMQLTLEWSSIGAFYRLRLLP
ncbi:MAG TPA: Calx-beta domain-containing protein, partial [Candidatus Saccharimonadales bacterium]|nr:Calx-beta domain-containing protein [Candidatus Saccharimonadales bacterium]